VRFIVEGATYVKMEVPNMIQPFTFIAVNQVKVNSSHRVELSSLGRFVKIAFEA